MTSSTTRGARCSLRLVRRRQCRLRLLFQCNHQFYAAGSRCRAPQQAHYAPTFGKSEWCSWRFPVRREPTGWKYCLWLRGRSWLRAGQRQLKWAGYGIFFSFGGYHVDRNQARLVRNDARPAWRRGIRSIADLRDRRIGLRPGHQFAQLRRN